MIHIQYPDTKELVAQLQPSNGLNFIIIDSEYTGQSVIIRENQFENDVDLEFPDGSILAYSDAVMIWGE